MFAEFNLFIGLNDQNTLKQEIPTEKALELVMAALPDCTIYACTGKYNHTDGRITTENSFRVTIYAELEKYDDLKKACQQLKIALNQAAIIISWRPAAETEFI